MDGFAPIVDAPFRDPRYAPRRLDVVTRPDGSIVLTNPTPVAPAGLTTNAALERWAGGSPSRIWLAERSGAGRREVAYAEACGRVAALAGGLAALGLGPERPLLILARNGIDHALVGYGAMRLGAPISPVSPQYGLPGADPERLAHAAALIRPGAVYVEDWAEMGGAVAGYAALDGLPVIASRGAEGRAMPLTALERGAALADRARPDQAAKLLLTSGSTGKPKAVVCTHANIAWNAAQITACFDDPEPPVVVNAAPWSHSLGANAILHMVLHRGGTLHVDHGQPTPARFGETLRNLSEVSPTYHNMVPAGWALLADALERDAALAATFFARVRVLQYGGASMPQSVCDRIEAAAVRAVGERISFATGYGATETGPTACNVHWPNARSGLIGLPVAGTAVKLAPQPRRDAYEVCVRGPQVSPGYREADGALRLLALDADGFHPLGDAVRLADPADPATGLVFDGRLTESFKLASGTFVAAGALRPAALSAIGGPAADAVVCGEGRDGVGLLVFLNAGFCEGMTREAVAEAVRAGLERLNAHAAGGAGRVARALILADAPDPHSGEITDKGYINQARARARRAAEVERLFADPADPAVIVSG